LFDKALAINPNNTGALSEKGRALLKLGVTNNTIDVQKFNEAIGLFDKALAINPNNTDVLNDKQRALDPLSKQK
jgi:Flp pilus assembly protein TadD